MKDGADTVDRILDAGEWIVVREGAARLTLDAVAARAGVSKGGLLYHFPSRRDLLRALLHRFVDRAEQRVDRERPAWFGRRGAELQATMRGWLNQSPLERRSAHALLAAVLHEPGLLSSVRPRIVQATRRLLAEARRQGVAPARAAILMLAIRGLWMSEILRVGIGGVGGRAGILKELLAVAEEWYGASAGGARR